MSENLNAEQQKFIEKLEETDKIFEEILSKDPNGMIRRIDSIEGTQSESFIHGCGCRLGKGRQIDTGQCASQEKFFARILDALLLHYHKNLRVLQHRRIQKYFR